MSLIRVYTRVGCHLCEEAERVVARLARRGDTVEMVDIDADPAITDDYTIRVPVVEVDGAEIAQYQVDEGALLQALTSAP